MDQGGEAVAEQKCGGREEAGTDKAVGRNGVAVARGNRWQAGQKAFSNAQGPWQAVPLQAWMMLSKSASRAVRHDDTSRGIPVAVCSPSTRHGANLSRRLLWLELTWMVAAFWGMLKIRMAQMRVLKTAASCAKACSRTGSVCQVVCSHGSTGQCTRVAAYTKESKSQHRAHGQQQPQELLLTCPGCAAFSLSPSRHWQM